jgi:DNA-binding beta-propeller fold protein YncE
MGTVGYAPSGIAFDGIYIWVANRDDNTVTKLRASDGSLVGTYAVGIGPMGIGFDGANIWVTNSGDKNVTKL